MHRAVFFGRVRIRRTVHREFILVLAWLAIAPAVLAAASADAHEFEPFTGVLLALTVILASAKIAGHLSVKLGQPAVLGELIAGIVLGNLSLLGVTAFETIAANPTVDALSRLGVVILLFEVGLQSTVREMFQVGLPSLLVAVLGVITPFALGWGVSAWLLADRSPYVHAFIGATLTATSVGITARVLQDLGRSRTPEARVILGAAVIDDVLGLMILAVVSGLITSANRGVEMSYLGIGAIVGKAVVFLVTALALGVWFSRRIFGVAARLRGSGVLLAMALIFCFGLAYLASIVGLAPIVGAYAAGLILEPIHFQSFVERGEQQLEQLLHPISTFLVPVFFVIMGMRVDSVGIRPAQRAGPRRASDRRRYCRQTGVLPRGYRPLVRSRDDRHRDDSSGRSRADLRECRPGPERCRATGGRPGGVLSHSHRGDCDNHRRTAGAQVESGPTLARP